ncbi:NADH ubiquinone oxidoreductase 20 kDa subunit [Ammonifex degensii KC4]|uniref:NADH ubiquinone oxidoreductase 20 kDa subunit n=1 Tax=Ammonifex degensii (strain DSM 10501 / KC4) TaxID=429009 RepID=C9R9W3_AMMDK|nr:oxidoreductase [Ammonifex degensii]ACX53092.1 NADH ubiquinone oxidoreductase 20 kDa subunit [Ammonifex degensii KC4]
MAEKLKIASYWAADCGGCDVAILDTHEKFLDIVQAADIVFMPIAVDIKEKDVEAFPDGYIDVCFFHGAIRNSENEHMAKLLRRKSKVLVAFGSCAMMGGVPGLANFKDREGILSRVYFESPSTDNPDKVLPQTETQVREGVLTLPAFYEEVKTLADVVDVDYFMPGCPPASHQIVNVFQAIVAGNLPPKGSIVGASTKSVCEECSRIKENKTIKRFYRVHEIIPDPERCLLEQGIPCMGPATRGGCGAACPVANQPCRGCYGPLDGVIDHGAKYISALASVIDANNPEEAAKIFDQIADPAGMLYWFGLPASLLRRVRK